MSWVLEEIDINGDVVREIDSGTGSSNKMKTYNGLEVNDTTCLKYTLTDSYGDGICCARIPNALNGNIKVYWNGELTETMDGKAYSTEYETSGNTGYEGSISYIIQDGVEPYGGSCTFSGQDEPATGCHEDTAIDVIFVLDTASDLLADCQNTYFPAIIDLVENYLPRDSLKISIVTYGTDESTRINNIYTPVVNTPLTNSNSLTEVITFDGTGTTYEWDTLKAQIEDMSPSECIGGGHATPDAINVSITTYVNEYGDTYDTTRQQYILLFTNQYIDIEQTQNRFGCGYFNSILEANGINTIIITETYGSDPGTDLTCLTDNSNYLIDMNYFTEIDNYYERIQNLTCSC